MWYVEIVNAENMVDFAIPLHRVQLFNYVFAETKLDGKLHMVVA